jgi:hypothetical protein
MIRLAVPGSFIEAGLLNSRDFSTDDQFYTAGDKVFLMR